MSNQALVTRLAKLPISQMGLHGGSLCLDFVNTFAWRTSREANDRLQNLDDLLAWGIYVGLLSSAEVDALYPKSQKGKVLATPVVEEALLLRESIYRIFSAIIVHKVPDSVDITRLRTIFAEAVLRVDLIDVGESYIWQVPPHVNDLRVISWSVSISAIELITSDEVNRVRECQNEGCGYLFVDRTRNGSRLWCTSDICGNRARVRRYYDRSRENR